MQINSTQIIPPNSPNIVRGILVNANTASGASYTPSNNGVSVQIVPTGSAFLGIQRGYGSLVNARGTQNYGVITEVGNAFTDGEPEVNAMNFGGRFMGYSNIGFTPADFNYGSYGEACGARINIGVFGIANPEVREGCLEFSGQTYWAGYFDGDVLVTGNVTELSDENLKLDVEAIENATEILSQLSPKRYTFDTETYGYVGLPSGQQMGLIAQEVETVLPNLVKEIVHPSRVTHEGEKIGQQLEFKGLNYTQFIPLLIAGFNEQVALSSSKASEVEDLKAEIESMRALIYGLNEQVQSALDAMQAVQMKANSCCDQFNSGQLVSPQMGSDKQLKLEQNIPNPFTDATRIEFSLPRKAQVILEINDANGRIITQLINGNLNEGVHITNFDGSFLTPGMYFYTVYADGEVLTRKMIKR